MMSSSNTLADWLAYQAQLHPVAMDFGLDRVKAVADRLQLLSPKARVITVAGTNGKGSSTAMLSAIYTQAGYLTGWYSSPHIWHYHERVRINQKPVSDAQLISAFVAIEQAREDTTLTVFEWGTLAALWLFAQASCEVIVLEVGLGGRLDAVNILDADCALITAIDLDHVQYLGDNREQIGKEKAGIMRTGKPAVVSDPHPPQSLIDYAQQIGVSSLSLQGKDYTHHEKSEELWTWGNQHTQWVLPKPTLLGEFQLRNAAGVLAVVSQLQPLLPVSLDAQMDGLRDVRLAGRLQRYLKVDKDWLIDIAHNPQSIQALVDYLSSLARSIRLVFSALEDKDITQMMLALKPVVTAWYIAPLHAPRGAGLPQLQSSAEQAGLSSVVWCDDIAMACERAQHGDVAALRVACGSFLTIEQVGHWLGVSE